MRRAESRCKIGEAFASSQRLTTVSKGNSKLVEENGSIQMQVWNELKRDQDVYQAHAGRNNNILKVLIAVNLVFYLVSLSLA